MKLFEGNRLYVDMNRWKYENIIVIFAMVFEISLPEIYHLFKSWILNLQIKA